MKRSLLKLFFSILLITGGDAVAQSWPYIGSDNQISSNAVSYTSLVTADVVSGSETYASVPHVAYTENDGARVKRFINGEWQSVGGNITTASTTYTYLFADKQGKLYLSYVDESAAGSKRLVVKTFNTGTNTWEALGGNAGNLYLSSGSVLQTVGSQHNTAHNSWMAFDANNTPYVVFSEFSTNSGRPVVKKFNGTAWVTVGGASVSTDAAISVGIAFDNAGISPYVVYEAGATSTGTIKLYKLTDNSWSSITVPTQVNGSTTGQTTATRHSNMVIDNDDNVHIVYFNASNANKATVIKYSPSSTTWAFSQAISTRDSPNITAIKAANGDLYISFADLITNNSGRSVARVFKLANGTSTWTELMNAEVTVGIDEPASSISVAVGNDGSEYVSYAKSSIAIVRTYSTAAPPPTPPIEPDVVVTSPKQMEYLTRGVVAVRVNTSDVLVSWRLLGTDPSGISFNVYRNGIKVNPSPITASTNYLDNTPANGTYTVKEVINGAESKESNPVSVWASNYLKIPIDRPAGGTLQSTDYTYSPNDASIGDVDGDGEYEIFVKWDPSNSQDNSISGYTGNVYIDCYKLNGTKLWRIDLGRNIRAGAHYTQFMVYDFDGDGKAEMACKTADATIDGTGVVIGDIAADYRNSSGYVLSGPEYLTMFSGLTGKALSTVNFIPGRGTVSSWGDNYGNRVDRFIAAVAYLDGVKPSLIMGRGYYTRLVRVAWDFVDGKLQQRWTFDSNTTANSAYAGQGNHQMSIADVDADGKQEILNGSSVINDNGTAFWTDSKGHGDALHVSDMNPATPELEEWMNHEEQGKYSPYGLRLKNVKTGATLWGVTTTGDVGRSMAADIDPNYPGYEVWSSPGVYSITGTLISTNRPSQNFGIWWDGDLSREILDDVKIDKWNPTTKSVNRLVTFTNQAAVASNNTTKATPNLSADILGDWREEVLLRASDGQSLYLFSTTYATDKRIYTLMHDPQYRVAISWQNSAYNQPPHPGYFLGNDMNTPPVPNIFTINNGNLPISLVDFKAKPENDKVLLSWETSSETNNKAFTVERSAEGNNFEAVVRVNGAGNSSKLLRYTAADYSPLDGKSYYRLRQTDFDGKSTISGVQVVNMLKKETGLIISPNPVIDEVNIGLDTKNTALTYSLMSIDGKIILQASGGISQVNQRINSVLSSLSPGVYFLRLNDAGKSYAEKLIKTNN